jgi:hypothetical protein
LLLFLWLFHSFFCKVELLYQSTLSMVMQTINWVEKISPAFFLSSQESNTSFSVIHMSEESFFVFVCLKNLTKACSTWMNKIESSFNEKWKNEIGNSIWFFQCLNFTLLFEIKFFLKAQKKQQKNIVFIMFFFLKLKNSLNCWQQSFSLRLSSLT